MDTHRKQAWLKIKSAVRSYAKDPTALSAEQVEQAWTEFRRMENLTHWRERRTAALDTRNLSNHVGQK